MSEQILSSHQTVLPDTDGTYAISRISEAFMARKVKFWVFLTHVYSDTESVTETKGLAYSIDFGGDSELEEIEHSCSRNERGMPDVGFIGYMQSPNPPLKEEMFDFYTFNHER